MASDSNGISISFASVPLNARRYEPTSTQRLTIAHSSGSSRFCTSSVPRHPADAENCATTSPAPAMKPDASPETWNLLIVITPGMLVRGPGRRKTRRAGALEDAGQASGNGRLGRNPCRYLIRAQKSEPEYGLNAINVPEVVVDVRFPAE